MLPRKLYFLSIGCVIRICLCVIRAFYFIVVFFLFFLYLFMRFFNNFAYFFFRNARGFFFFSYFDNLIKNFWLYPLFSFFGLFLLFLSFFYFNPLNIIPEGLYLNLTFLKPCSASRNDLDYIIQISAYFCSYLLC